MKVPSELKSCFFLPAYIGRYFLKPGPMNYGEERLLQFFGQLLGIALRAAIPLPLDLMPSFWRSLVGQPLTSWTDDPAAAAMDPVTAGYLASLEAVPTAEAFESWLEEQGWPKLTYASLAGTYVELAPGGAATPLTWHNRGAYVAGVRELRLREWEARERVLNVRAGLGTVAPLSLILHTFSPADLELRLCGQPYVDLKFLRAHTIYQVDDLKDFSKLSARKNINA
jgi:E3 ubiquitin-protein ligase HECTD4